MQKLSTKSKIEEKKCNYAMSKMIEDKVYIFLKKARHKKLQINLLGVNFIKI